MSKVIALDIGHGNNTFPPGKGVYKDGKGYAEFDFNNKLGKRVKRLLEHNGFKVIMAQPFDSKDVYLVNRTNYYDSKRPDLGISLHANAGTASANGRCAFYWYTSSQGKQFATNIIKNMKGKGYSVHGNGLHAAQYNSWTNLHVIRESTTFPMVLVEHGFMTNSLDFPLIFGNKQERYIKDMADCDVKAVCDYFGVPFKTLSNDAGAPAPEEEWQTNQYGTQYLKTSGTFKVGGTRIMSRIGSPFLSAPEGGYANPGWSTEYSYLLRQDNHIWIEYYVNGQTKYLPVKTWNSVTGEVSTDWGTFS